MIRDNDIVSKCGSFCVVGKRQNKTNELRKQLLHTALCRLLHIGIRALPFKYCQISNLQHICLLL